MERTNSAVLVAPRRIELQSFPLPRIGSDDGLLRVLATGICGSDWAPYAGTWMTELPPLVLGHEVVGEVVEIGGQAARRWGVAVGDRVVLEESIPCQHCRLCRTGRTHMCDPMHTPDGLRYGLTPSSLAPHLWGGFGEYVYLHPRSVLHRISSSVPIDVAPLFIPISNGIRWIERDGGCRIGDTVVILGPGQHGLGCVVGAGLAGAGTTIVVGTARDHARLKLAADLGADHVVCIDDGPLQEQISLLTGGQMADVVVDVTAGAPGALGDAVSVAGVGATVIVAGSREMVPATGFRPDELFFKEVTVKGVYGHDYMSVERAIAVIASGSMPLGAMCTHTFGLDQVDAALRTLGGEGDDEAVHITVVPG
ncbi:zinc-binding dehydrogenase [Williamsia sp.]|uniref:zinc-dependent alcohol dehydrogenase n=1 Tax=Williamsia sp. TaxID=1872085 RepID=UPI002F94342A